MTVLTFPRKDPQAKLPYQVDWSDWLDDGETIDSATITATGCDKLGEQIVEDGKATRVILGGGVAGDIAEIHFHVVTVSGIEDDRTVYLEIVDM